MSDRPHKIIDRVDTKAAGNAVAVVDEIAVGRERQGRRGDFQPAMLGSTALLQIVGGDKLIIPFC